MIALPLWITCGLLDRPSVRTDARPGTVAEVLGGLLPVAVIAQSLQVALVVLSALRQRHDVIPLRRNGDPAFRLAAHAQGISPGEASITFLPLAPSDACYSHRRYSFQMSLACCRTVLLQGL